MTYLKMQQDLQSRYVININENFYKIMRKTENADLLKTFKIKKKCLLEMINIT